MSNIISQAEAVTLLEEIADEIHGSVYKDYSGRAMYGATCYGIKCDYPREAIEVATVHGIVGASQDQLGLSAIVYWKRITGKLEDKPIELVFKEREDDEEEDYDDEDDDL